MLDGEIVSLESAWEAAVPRSTFPPRRARFYVFDVLWNEHAASDDDEETRRFRNGEDCRYLPLSDRKQRLRSVVQQRGERLLCCDHIEAAGEQFFRLICETSIVAKRKGDPYLPVTRNFATAMLASSRPIFAPKEQHA